MEPFWTQHYPPHVDSVVDVSKYESIVEMFETSAKQYAKKPALCNFGVQISYAELDNASQNFAAFLQCELGLNKGQRLAIMVPNLIQYPVVLFGALRAGLIIVNVNPLYTAREIAYQLDNAGADVIVVLENFAKVLSDALPQTPVKQVIITKVGDHLGVKGILINFISKFIKRMVPKYKITSAIRYNDAIKKGKKQPLLPVAITHNDVAFLQYTGGTTGVSKGAMLTHGNMIANVLQITQWIFPDNKGDKEVVVTPLPLYHIFSLTCNCLVSAYVGAFNLLITDPKDINGFIKTLKRYPFTMMTGVNTLYNALLNHPKFSSVDFSHIRLMIGGGASIQPSVAEKWQKITQSTIVQGYGLTETAPVLCINDIALTAFNTSIGPPLPQTEVSIRDDDGNECGIEQPGELWVKGPQVMRGYWQMPEETRKVFTDDDWLKTGDIVQMDKQGYLTIVDRKKDLILVSGFNVYPNEVEEVIASHQSVSECAVIGVEDDGSGEQVKAFIVKGAPDITEEEIIAYCKQNLTAYKIPKIIEFRESLPKSNIGKILRKELR